MAKTSTETLNNINKKLSSIADGWDIKELQVQVNETEMFISLKAVKAPEEIGVAPASK